MSGLYGDFVAKYVTQGRVAVTTNAFVPLVADTTTDPENTDGTDKPLPARRQLRIQIKANLRS